MRAQAPEVIDDLNRVLKNELTAINRRRSMWTGWRCSWN